MVVRRALGVSSLAEAEDRAFCVTPRLPPAAANLQGMTEQYRGDNEKRAPPV